MRLVACDLDGTVIGPDGAISPRTLAAFEDCLAQGVEVIFATGRPARWMPPVAAATGHRGLAICSNGAVLYDLGADLVVGSRPIDAGAVRDVVRLLRPALATDLGEPAFALETLEGFRREPGYLPRHELALQAMVGDVPELLADHPTVVKVLCRLDAGRADPMLAVARATLAGLAEPVHSGADGSMLEISGLGVSKASTLAGLAADRGIAPADVVAFGDMPNDVPMLRWAGTGYAMASGHPEAIAAADAVAPAFTQDGVAQVLETLLGRRAAAR